jgi:YegS/Rv2252/BmrU family lipid kinase
MVDRTSREGAGGIRSALVIVNPVAGRGDAAAVEEECSRILAPLGWRVRFALVALENGGRAHVIDEVRRAAGAGVSLVAAAGGDGTVSMVADALIRVDAAPPISLGILPTGTGNILAKELSIPAGLPEAVALLADEHGEVRLDAMRVGDRHYFSHVGIGLDAEMIGGTTREAQSKFGRIAYAASLVRAALRHRAMRTTIEVDGREVRVRALQAVVANAGTLGAPPLKWGPDIHPADGKLNVCVIRAIGLVELVRTAWRALWKRPADRRNVLYIPLENRAAIRTKDPIRVQADGELIGTTPLEVQLVPHAVRVIVPQAAAASLEAEAPGAASVTDEAEAAAGTPDAQKEVRREVQEKRLSRIGTLGAIDAAAFLRINALFHHPVVDWAMRAVSRATHHGEVWIAILLAGVLFDTRAGLRAMLDVLPALLLTTLTVNFGLKRLARRPRPFIAQVKAVVVGRRPSDASFPSGHTAAAFAGAWLLSIHYPRWSIAYYAYATLVGWSRVHLGVHYPGDILVGAGIGILLAMAYQGLFAAIFF